MSPRLRATDGQMQLFRITPPAGRLIAEKELHNATVANFRQLHFSLLSANSLTGRSNVISLLCGSFKILGIPRGACNHAGA